MLKGNKTYFVSSLSLNTILADLSQKNTISLLKCPMMFCIYKYSKRDNPAWLSSTMHTTPPCKKELF